MFGTKSAGWRYEAEFRLILLNKSGLIRFNKPFLSGVIFGLRVNEEDVKRFMSMCSECGYENLRFSRMKKVGLEFRIEKITEI